MKVEGYFAIEFAGHARPRASINGRRQGFIFINGRGLPRWLDQGTLSARNLQRDEVKRAEPIGLGDYRTRRLLNRMDERRRFNKRHGIACAQAATRAVIATVREQLSGDSP